MNRESQGLPVKPVSLLLIVHGAQFRATGRGQKKKPGAVCPRALDCSKHVDA